MRGIPYRTALPWLGLAAILSAYIAAVAWIRPTNLFGYTNDDMMYFSSAKALAQGRGYILPSVPGAPPATKYPVFLPWMLSLVWRADPSFPANLSVAIGVVVAFGCVFLVGGFLFLRRCFGLNTAEALTLTGFCALQPMILLYSSSILSDIPFAALAILAVLVSDRALHRDGGLAPAAASGLLAGLSILMRATGIPFTVGLFLFAVTKRAWRQAAAFATAVVPFALLVIWRAFMAVPAVPRAVVSSPGPGWRQTWFYYTNYVAFRRMASPDLHMTWTFLLNQFLYLVSDIPGYFLSPFSRKSVVFWFVSALVVVWLTVGGIVRQARRSSCQPVHLALAMTVLAVLSWDYPDSTRFLIPFLPIFAAGFWSEGKRAALMLRDAARASVRRTERLLSAAGLIGIAGLFLCVTVNFFGPGRNDLRRESLKRAGLLAEKREAYDWLERNSQTQDRVIASEDGCLYLYTGRQAMSSIAPLPGGAYDKRQLKIDLGNMLDVARAIGARYWIGSADDSEKQWSAARGPLEARLAAIESALPEVFRSSRGGVTIYDLGCVRHPQEQDCQAADAILFPSDTDRRGGSFPEDVHSRSEGRTVPRLSLCARPGRGST